MSPADVSCIFPLPLPEEPVEQADLRTAASLLSELPPGCRPRRHSVQRPARTLTALGGATVPLGPEPVTLTGSSPVWEAGIVLPEDLGTWLYCVVSFYKLLGKFCDSEAMSGLPEESTLGCGPRSG